MKNEKNENEDAGKSIELELTRMTTEERARLMIDLYFGLDSPDERIAQAFFQWLDSPADSDIKEALLQRKFEEILDNVNCGEPHIIET